MKTGGKLTVRMSTFTENAYSGSAGGGAINVEKNTELAIHDSAFIDNAGSHADHLMSAGLKSVVIWAGCFRTEILSTCRKSIDLKNAR